MSKLILEHCHRLHIRDLKAVIPPRAIRAEVELESGDDTETVRIIGKLTNLKNGYRHYLRCNRCERAQMILYRRDFGELACRCCLDLVYASSMKRAV